MSTPSVSDSRYTIVFIQEPLFQVDFRQYSSFLEKDQKNPSIRQRIQSAALFSLKCVKCFFIAVPQAAYVTIKHSKKSFEYRVLGLHGKDPFGYDVLEIPQTFYILVVRINCWVAGLIFCCASTTVQILIKNFKSHSSATLKHFLSNEFNFEHIQTKDLSIDVSKVPQNIRVDDLLKAFDEINFSKPAAPGYMSPTALQEHITTYSVEDLKKSLQTFVSHVNGRASFLGTPPSHDIPRLMRFYQQIENAVRVSIHAVNQDLEEFLRKNPGSFTDYPSDRKKEYKNLLENRARLVIDLAIAGKHCGARYMGDAMSCYQSFGKTNQNQIEGTLESDLFELLANKRKEIAEEKAARLGNDAHTYSEYMAKMGEILALPGTRDVIEHLRSSLDHNELLRDFSSSYTVDVIIDTVQKHFKTCKPFQQKVYDWLQIHAEEWNKEQFQKDFDEVNKEISPVMEKGLEKQELEEQLQSGFRKKFGHALDSKVMNRILNKEIPLQTGIELFLNEDRKSLFVDAFFPTEKNGEYVDPYAEGVSPAFMEWLLVSHKILLPQTPRAKG
jgi:hypothetical protein